MNNRFDIIIIGAGAAGLMAAKELTEKGKKVLILEARNRAGGRIETLHSSCFQQPVEAGAEFVHGNLPLTLQLLQQARIGYTKVEGKMLRLTNGKLHASDEMVEGWSELMEKMNHLKQDITLMQFLDIYVPDNNSVLRQSALQYAQGFDAVNPEDASTFALRNEWLHEQDVMYRVDGGYEQLVQYLITLIRQQQGSLEMGKAVNLVSWKEGEVNLTTHTGETFRGDKLLVTVPFTILSSSEGTAAHIRFEPVLHGMGEAAEKIGYGSVIKILLQFDNAFWQNKNEPLFFFSDEKIPTWWTQAPSDYPLLTGWVAGKQADELCHYTNNELLYLAIESLSAIFNTAFEEIQKQLTASHIANWRNDVFAQGAYSYNKLATDEVRQRLEKAVLNTIFFAGEALYTGTSGGTVEAALVSGQQAAKRILEK